MNPRSSSSRVPLTQPAPPGLVFTQSSSSSRRRASRTHGVDEGEDVVPERGRLGLLQVGLVGHQRVRVLLGAVAGLPRERDRLRDQLDQLAPEVEAQGDAGRLPPRPAGVQPARDVADARDEVVLPRVVGLAEGGVVGEVLGRDLLDVEQEAEQVPLRLGRDDAAAREVEHVGDVGEVEPAVQEGRVGVLQREAGFDQLRRRAALRRAPLAGAAGCGHAQASVRWARAGSRPPVCQKTTGPAAGSRSSSAANASAP